MVMTREEFEERFERKSRGEGTKLGGLTHGDISSLAKRLVNAMDDPGTGHDEIEAVLGVLNSHTEGKSSNARNNVFKRIAEEFKKKSPDKLSLRDALIKDYSEFSDWNIGGTDHDEDSILKAFGFAEDAIWGDTSEKSDAESTIEGLNVPNMDRYGPDGNMTYGRGEPELDAYELYKKAAEKPESKVIDADAEPTPPAEPEYPEDADQMPDDSEFGVRTPPPGTVDPGNGLPPREEGFEGFLTEEEPIPDSGHGFFPGDELAEESDKGEPETSSYVDINGEIITENLRDVSVPEPPPPYPTGSENPFELVEWNALNKKYQQELKQEEADAKFNADLKARHSDANRKNTTPNSVNLGRLRKVVGTNSKTGQPIYDYETRDQQTQRINDSRQQRRDAQRNAGALANFRNPKPDNRRAVTPSKKRNFDISDMPYETRIAYELANLKGAGKLIDQTPEPKFKPAGYGQEYLAGQKGNPLYDPFVPGRAWQNNEEQRQAKRDLAEWNAKTSEQILAEADAAQEERMAAEIRDKMGAGSGPKTKKFTGAIGSSAFGIDPSANRSGSFHKGWTGAHVPYGPGEGQEWTPEGIENLEGQMDIAGLIDGADEAAWEPEIPAGIDESTLQDEPTRLPSGEILPPLPPDDNSGTIDAYMSDPTQWDSYDNSGTIDAYMSDPTQWDSYNQVPPLDSAIASADRLLEEIGRDRNPGIDMDAMFNGPEYPVIDIPSREPSGRDMTWFPDMGSSPIDMYDGPLMPFDESGPLNIYDGPLYNEEDEELQNTINSYMNGEGWTDTSNYDPWNPGLGYSDSFEYDPWNQGL